MGSLSCLSEYREKADFIAVIMCHGWWTGQRSTQSPVPAQPILWSSSASNDRRLCSVAAPIATSVSHLLPVGAWDCHWHLARSFRGCICLSFPTVSWSPVHRTCVYSRRGFYPQNEYLIFFVSGPCARLSWPSRQLLSAR